MGVRAGRGVGAAVDGLGRQLLRRSGGGGGRFGGSALRDPRIVTAEQRSGLAKSVVEKYLRRTGAGVFARSRAVGDDFAVARYLFQTPLKLVERDVLCPLDFGLDARAAHVEDD